MAQYPWDEIKTKYETGKYSIRQLADKYGFNASYGRRKAKENNWVKGKSSKKVTEKVNKKVIEEEAEKEAKLRQEYEKIITNIRRGAYQALMQEQSFDRLKQFKIASQIIRNCRKEQWEVNQITETAEKVEQELYGKGGGPIEFDGDPKERLKRAINRIAEREKGESD